MTLAEVLGCQGCGLPITPCLVCANPIPVSHVDDLLIKACPRCGVVNPLGNRCREMLQIPSISSLPPAMVRRSQITRVGRRPYVLAKHAHFAHSTTVRKRKGEDEQNEDSEPHWLAIQEIFARCRPKGSPVPEIAASAEGGDPLTFLPYMQDSDARIHQEALRSFKNAVDVRRLSSFSDSESPVNRMQLAPMQEDDKVAEKLSGSNTGNSDKLPSTTVGKVDAEEVYVPEADENDNPFRDPSGSEEIPIHRHERLCSDCGQTVEGSRKLPLNLYEQELTRCLAQILELHCSLTFEADVRTPSAYPLCCPILRFPSARGNSTSLRRVCRSYATQFTVDALRAAHSTLTSHTQTSTSEEVTFLCGVKQTLSMAELFIKSKERMGHVQGLIQEVDAARAQAFRDLLAYGDRDAFSLAGQLVPCLLSREKQQNVDRVKNDVQVLMTFLQDINKLLTSCFQYVQKILEASLSSVDDNYADSSAKNLSIFMLNVDSKFDLEAVRTAASLWLCLYHDVAHASVLLK